MRKTLRTHTDTLLTLAVSALGLVLYTLTAAPSVLLADSGEFQFVPYIAGITHPTGYPLYTILGWAWTHLIILGDVAHRMNLFSAFWGAATLALLYQVMTWSLRLIAPECPAAYRRCLAILVALLLGVSGTFWSQAVVAEVYTLNSAFVAAMLYLALRLWDAATRQERLSSWLIALSLTYGLSLTHHRTMVLLLPWLVFFVWMISRKAPVRWRGVMPWMLAGLVLPQFLYLYIPLRAPYVPYAQLTLDSQHKLVLYENSLSGFLDLVLGGAFGGQLGEAPITGARFTMAFELLLNQFTWIGFFLGLAGLVSLGRRRACMFLMLTLPAYLTYVAFNLLYFIGDIYVLFIPSYLIWSIWIGLGLWEVVYLASRALGRTAHGNNRLAAPILALGFALAIWILIGNFSSVDQSQNRVSAEMWQPILSQPLPTDPVLVSNDRDEIMPLWYHQYVDGLKPGWLGIFPLIVRQPGYENVGQVISSALSSERPVFLIKPMPGLEVKYQLQAAGPLVRVVGAYTGRKPPHPVGITLGGSMLLAGYDEERQSEDRLTISLYWEPLKKVHRPFSSFIHIVGPAGQTVASDDHRLGGIYYPTNMWQPGEVLLDRHELSIPPPASGVYSVTTGLYSWPDMTRLGEEIRIGQISVDG